MNKVVDSKKAFTIIGITAFIVFCIGVPFAILGIYLIKNISPISAQHPYIEEPTSLPFPTQTIQPTSTQIGLLSDPVTTTPQNNKDFGAAQYFF